MTVAAISHSEFRGRGAGLCLEEKSATPRPAEPPVLAGQAGVAVTFLLIPGFCLFSVSAAIEAFEHANRLAQRQVYRWRFVSVQDRHVESDAGISLECGTDIGLELHGLRPFERTDILFLSSDRPASQILTVKVKRYLQEVYRSGARLIGAGRGTLLLAETGFLNGARCAAHWQYLPEFDARYPKVEVDCRLYDVGDRITTCAGQTATLDLAMSLVRQDLGAEIASQLCNHHVVEQVRPARHRQRRPDTSSIKISNPRLAAAISIMKANIVQPLPLTVLARQLGMSRRQVERLFELEGQQAPARFYLHVRLEEAQTLLQKSDLPIVDIGKACGFVSASHFSKCYRRRFGHSPKREREKDDD